MSGRWAECSRSEGLRALLLFLFAGAVAALGLAWWRDRTRVYASPSWQRTRFAAVATEHPHGERERWVVAIQLRCPHCTSHLRWLERRVAGRAQPPALAALIVDQPARPRTPELGGPLAGGVWWDSAQVWREEWGRRAYGETFRFDARGRLLSATPVGVLPDSVGSRR